jgi:2-polyprenyl-6-methoxyphenol hydroxylase-like FAD-dependent oxidoreductase
MPWVGCDGMASRTREMVFGPAAGFDAGWVLWTWWADGSRPDPAVAREWWGLGWLFGVYPAPGRVMCAAGVPADAVRGNDVPGLLRHLLAGRIEAGTKLAAQVPEITESRTRSQDFRIVTFAPSHHP